MTATGPPAAQVDSDPGPDPAYVQRLLRSSSATAKYFSPQVRGLDNLPATGPVLLVGNHSGMPYIPDFWITLDAIIRRRGAGSAVHMLTFDALMMTPGVGSVLRKIGAVPASPANAERALGGGAAVLVYPGGDWEACRPWWERDIVDLHGHTGFVRLALRAGVPVIPVVAHGAHHTMFVVSRGARLASALRLPQSRFRTNVLPFVVGPPLGVTAFAPAYPPPLPAAVTVQFLPPVEWTALGQDAADDDAAVQDCYTRTVWSMQSALDQLRAEQPHPLLSGSGQLLRSIEHGVLSGIERGFRSGAGRLIDAGAGRRTVPRQRRDTAA